MNKVIIIGGGAAGILAAISAAREGAKVTILEHKDRIGKKILSTGNGKCNYTNRLQGIHCYRGEDPAFVLSVLDSFGFEQTVEFFKELGIYPKEKNGYFYPASGQASSVVDVLRMELERLKVQICTECEPLRMKKTGSVYTIQTTKGIFKGDCLIFATGLKAFSKSGSDGSALKFAEQLGHHVSEIVPALVQLMAKESFFKGIAGIRSEGEIRLFVNDEWIASDRGELQLTEYGVSGIPTLQVSRFAAKALQKNQKVTAELDFAPDDTIEELFQILIERFYHCLGEKNCEEVLIGMYPKKLIPMFLKQTGISGKVSSKSISRQLIQSLANVMKTLKIHITDTKGFECAQVCAGGILTEELNEYTMESLLVPGLFFCGEIVDIDGICGGYNLQWAWSSGYLAGKYAAHYEKDPMKKEIL